MPTEEARFQCRHILSDGHRCRAACLRHEEFCYFHHASRKPVADPAKRRSRRAVFTMPRIEDRASLQSAVNEIIQLIASNRIDPVRAGRILYGIQIARSNMPRLAAITTVSSDPQSSAYDDEAPGPVEEIVLHPTFGAIAPRSELTPPVKRKRLAQELLEEMEALEARNIAEFGPFEDDDPPPTGPRSTDIERELREAREELAAARAQLAEARNDTLRAEQCMVLHMDHRNEVLAELESLKAASQPQPQLLDRLQAVAAPPSSLSVNVKNRHLDRSEANKSSSRPKRGMWWYGQGRILRSAQDDEVWFARRGNGRNRKKFSLGSMSSGQGGAELRPGDV